MPGAACALGLTGVESSGGDFVKEREMFFVFHGPDEFSRAEAVARLQERLGDPTMASLNTTYLDGRKSSFEELRHACDSIPFMSKQRLVIAQGFLSRLQSQQQKRAAKSSEEKAGKKGDLERLLEYLPGLPETTLLVFVEEEALDEKHPALKLSGVQARNFITPEKGALQRWIVERAAGKGGKIEPRAASALESFVGGNLRLLDQELDKLLGYVGGDRPVREDDVHLLTPYVRETNIFGMVDAIRDRDGGKAISLLHQLLDEGKASLPLFNMIVNQFRTLIQVRELAEQGRDRQEVARILKLHPYAAQKSLEQARRFSPEQLRSAYFRLLETDLAIKTGQMSDLLALDVLILELCHK